MSTGYAPNSPAGTGAAAVVSLPLTATTSSPAATAARNTPIASMPTATGMSHAVWAAPTTSTATPAVASAFMMTAIHEPDSRSKVTVWAPEPWADSSQNVCSPGSAVGSDVPTVS